MRLREILYPPRRRRGRDLNRSREPRPPLGWDERKGSGEIQIILPPRILRLVESWISGRRNGIPAGVVSWRSFAAHRIR